ncbi:MAG: U32 family peptidase [Spirochaetes bacterium]|nr:MAG: U32 family peptidase [Spirochaetota bacterium]
MELLSPAGNIEKLYYAYTYGADAAYIGLKNFSLRAKADNFSDGEHLEIHRLKAGKRLYIALNIYFHDHDIAQLEDSLDYISAYPCDGFIISDIGILPLLRRRFPNKALHLSTQANCTNSKAARFYRDMGFDRIILGRELSLKDIETVKRKVPDVEIEVFVHGAMCLAYSGRCFLSRYMADRSANRGDCAGSCRWEYRILEEAKRPGEYYPVIEGENFTTILSSRDLCMIDHLKDLRDAGVDAIKIEGRMKSIYYTAVVTRAYRKMLDVLEGKKVDNLDEFKEELFKVSHREFTTGFYYGKEEIELPTEKSYLQPYRFMGTIRDEISPGRFRIHVKNAIYQGKPIEYTGPDVPVLRDKTFNLYDERFNPVEAAKHGREYYLETEQPVKPGYIIRKPVSG